MLQQHHSQHHLGRCCRAAASLALLAALHQFLLDEEQQGFVFQCLVGMAHPGFPKVLDLFEDKAIGESPLQAARDDHRWRSLPLDSSRSSRNRNWLISLMASRVSFVSL